MTEDSKLMKNMETMLKFALQMDDFGNIGDELSADELDNVYGGVTMPEFQKFLQYAKERSAEDKK